MLDNSFNKPMDVKILRKNVKALIDQKVLVNETSIVHAMEIIYFNSSDRSEVGTPV